MGSDSSGKLMIVFGFIHIGNDECVNIEDNVKVFQGKTYLSLKLTFVQDKKNEKWAATNGTMCIENGSSKLLDNSIIKIIGGKSNPIKIADQTFYDTTVKIENVKPVTITP